MEFIDPEIDRSLLCRTVEDLMDEVKEDSLNRCHQARRSLPPTHHLVDEEEEISQLRQQEIVKYLEEFVNSMRPNTLN